MKCKKCKIKMRLVLSISLKDILEDDVYPTKRTTTLHQCDKCHRIDTSEEVSSLAKKES